MEYTSHYSQVRDSPPAMTSPTALTVSANFSARGAHRAPSPSQVSNICVLRNTTNRLSFKLSDKPSHGHTMHVIVVIVHFTFLLIDIQYYLFL